MRMGPVSMLSMRRLAARADVPINGGVYVRVEPVVVLTLDDVDETELRWLSTIRTSPSIPGLVASAVELSTLVSCLVSMLMFLYLRTRIDKTTDDGWLFLFASFFALALVNTVDRTIMIDDRRSSESS